VGSQVFALVRENLMRPRPKHSDFAKPSGPAHEFEQAYYGWPRCNRCHRTLDQIQATQAPCVSDDAIKAGRVFARVTK